MGMGCQMGSLKGYTPEGIKTYGFLAADKRII